MSVAAGSKKNRNKHPQELVSNFWSKFFAKKQGKVTSIFPKTLYASLLPPLRDPRGTASSCNATESYEIAAEECREKVRRIVRECNRTNEKFTDPDFDIETDPDKNCLNGLVRSEYEPPSDGSSQASSRTAAASPGAVHGMKGIASPNNGVGGDNYFWTGAVHRVDWIFEKPQFTVDGFSSSDIMQGANGDCWWLAAVATIAHRRELMNKCCVARDEECGVYGFVFQRDGEWISTVVDDNLYLSYPDFVDMSGDTYDPTRKKARKYRENNQRGSEALYFSKCTEPNETWVPLLEKAYAKIHGDYEAIYGGWSGEAVEDMTGGVTTTINAKRVLKKDRLWKELANGTGDFVFAASAIGSSMTQNGLFMGHAYSILKATEEVDEDGNKFRLVQIRNPWGQREGTGLGEWNGPWSDGSKEWTPYWLKKMNHTFGDDGLFWMFYDDMLETFLFLHRTRLFDEKWTVIQQWTSVNISWVTGYLQTKFLIEITKSGTVVIVLTQLDDRYYQGFEGQYEFALHFLLQQENGKPGEHITRVRPVNPWEKRSVSCEVDLEPGRYEVLPKVTAVRDVDKKPVEEVVKHWAEKNPQKLRQVGMIYDLAHAKGGVPDEDEILEKQKAEAKKKRALEKQKAKDEAKKAEEQAAAEAAAAIAAGVPAPEIKTNGEEATEKQPVEGTSEPAAEVEKEEFQDATENPDNSDEKTNREEKKASKDEKDSILPGALPDKKKHKDKKDDNNEKKDDEQKKEDDKKKDEDKKDKDKKDDEEEDEESEAESDDDDDDDDKKRPPWNAVCVMGLRVYSQDPDVKITLVKPQDAQEASSLTVDETPAGATM